MNSSKFLSAVLGSMLGVTIVPGVVAAQNTDIIQLPDSYVRPDYVEVAALKDTKQIIVINKKDIQDKGYTSVTDVLQDVPSITVNATGYGNVDVRGQGVDEAHKNIQVMVDGAPITTLVNHPLSTDYNVVPVDQIEKIEIIPGGGAVMYGAGASGGVINITTNLRNLDKTKNRIKAEYNSNGYIAAINYKKS